MRSADPADRGSLAEPAAPGGAGERSLGRSGGPAPAPGSALPARSLVVAGLSTVVEWYDFTLYLYMATIMARVFYRGDESSVLITLAVFAVAYVLRPLGAVFFGRIGDRVGRRRVLLASMAVMCGAMWATAVLPTYRQVGIAAGGLLFLMRCVMGFSVGGEYNTVLTYLVEGAEERRRGLVASLASAGSEIGGLLAVGAAAATAALVPDGDMDTWGWRLPYAFGALLATGTLLARRGMAESPDYAPQPGGTPAAPAGPAAPAAVDGGPRAGEESSRAFPTAPEAPEAAETAEAAEAPEAPAAPAAAPTARPPRSTRALPALLRADWKPISRAFVMSAVGSVTYYGGVTYVTTFLTQDAGFSEADSLWLSTGASAVVIAATPLAGGLGDRFGRRPLLTAITALAVLLPVSMFALMASGAAAAALLGACVLAAIAGAFSAVAASAGPELFPTADRLTGLALGNATATAVFGGVTPYISEWLVHATGWDLAPGAFTAAVALLALPVLWLMPETAPLRVRARRERLQAK
ncbi:MFS transporter [Phaeacidiphilus oryzae]|uniref:MFS transporter n=1 Tax=Phaeacidiphilus oryzae TaxID=348818 RepID=UPI0007C85352|nr:MFS transporter [Phaeacidiphilus oryzae]